MTEIRQFFPDSINDPVWRVIGRVINDLKYYYTNFIDPEVFDADEVYPGIYVGDLWSSLNRKKLKDNGITHILSILNGCTENYPDDFQYKIIHINDDRWVKISDYFEETNKFIRSALEDGGKVLIHCSRGVSRSASAATAFIMDRDGTEIDDIIEKMRESRSKINPNPGFRAQLKEYKEGLKEADDEIIEKLNDEDI